MKSPDFYYTINVPSIAIFKDKGSKFIGYAFPISDQIQFKAYLTAIKKEHPKATHYCFAYRLGFAGDNFRVSDDGEPSGSAGKPILGQIDSNQLTNILIIVVRYFGGMQLGMPGLIHAYKSTAARSILESGITQKRMLINYNIRFNYTMLNEVMKVLKKFNCVIHKQEIQLNCSLAIGIPNKNLEVILNKFEKIKGVECEKTRE